MGQKKLAVLTGWGGRINEGFFLTRNNFLMQYYTKRHNDLKFPHGTERVRLEKESLIFSNLAPISLRGAWCAG